VVFTGHEVRLQPHRQSERKATATQHEEAMHEERLEQRRLERDEIQPAQ
jgi:hypothetical protein